MIYPLIVIITLRNFGLHLVLSTYHEQNIVLKFSFYEQN